jgi:hypothetical protein
MDYTHLSAADLALLFEVGLLVAPLVLRSPVLAKPLLI